MDSSSCVRPCFESKGCYYSVWLLSVSVTSLRGILSERTAGFCGLCVVGLQNSLTLFSESLAGIDLNEGINSLYTLQFCEAFRDGSCFDEYSFDTVSIRFGPVMLMVPFFNQ